MENKVVVFSDKNNVMKVFKRSSITALGHLDFTYLSCNSFGECLSILESIKDAQKTIVICDNNQIDGLIEKVKKDGDELELMFDQAIVLKSDEKKMLFLPIEVEQEKFLEEFLGQKEVFVCSIFGKSFNLIKNTFDNFKFKFGVSYEIITKTPFLHTVYYSNEIDGQILRDAFGEGLFSFKNEDLACALERVLKEKGLSIAVAEQVTAGALTSRLINRGKIELKESKMLLHEQDFEKLGLSQQFLAENGLVSKETAFSLARNFIKQVESDIVLVIVGETVDKTFYAFGNKEKIHVYSSVFDGVEDVLESVVDFALFRLFNFVNS